MAGFGDEIGRGSWDPGGGEGDPGRIIPVDVSG